MTAGGNDGGNPGPTPSPAGDAGAPPPERRDPSAELLARAPVAHAVYDLDGILVDGDATWAALLGYELDAVLGRRAESFVHPDDRNTTRELIERLAAGRAESVEAERRLLRSDGTTLWVSTTFSLERDDQGEPLHVHALALDISARKRTEAELRQSEERYRRLIDEAPVGQVVTDLDGRIIEVNKAFVELMGRSRAELAACDSSELYHPDDWAALSRQVDRLTRGETDYVEGTRRLIRGDGSTLWTFGGTTLIREGTQRYLHSVIQDVTERRLAEEALRGSEARFRTLTEALPLGVYQSDDQGRLLYVNPKWCEITGVAERDAVGHRVRYIVHPHDRAAVFASFRKAVRERQPYHAQYRIVRTDGEIRWVSTHGSVIIDPVMGTTSGYIGSIEDITPLVQSQIETSRLASIVESTSDLVSVIDVVSGEVLFLNSAARRLLGYGDDDTLVARDAYCDDAITAWYEQVRPTLEQGESWSGELAMRTSDGRRLEIWQTITGDVGPDGAITQVAAVGRDVTERRRHEAALAHQATHDPLTDLPNRVMVLDRADAALERARRGGTQVALLLIDLDRFKKVNDSFGPEVGDALLVRVATRLAGVVADSATLARMGGDEFVVLCDAIVDEREALGVAQRVLTAIEHAPFDVDGISIPMSASIGVAVSSGEQAAHPEWLLRDADAAMYRAKDHGRARIEVFDDASRARTASRLALADELARGIERGEIEVHFQPGVDLRTGRVVNVEALARWAHPTRGLLQPAEFISVAEETGLIVGLGLAVMTAACHQARRWLDDVGPGAPMVHVNLSARQLTSANLPVLVENVLRSTGLPADRLCLEITESALMEDTSAAIGALDELRQRGVVLGIDDFGTGYSSLSYLRRFPVDVLKIDRSFVEDLDGEGDDAAIAGAIINLAHTLGLETVAEGVETHAQLDHLRVLGCDVAQGYLFARPVPADQVPRLLGTVFAFELRATGDEREESVSR